MTRYLPGLVMLAPCAYSWIHFTVLVMTPPPHVDEQGPYVAISHLT